MAETSHHERVMQRVYLIGRFLLDAEKISLFEAQAKAAVEAFCVHVQMTREQLQEGVKKHVP